jgi:iron complex outermembrane receptor protein
MGSPQTHNQRNGRQPIGYYDEEYAAKQGVDTSMYPGQNYGLRHNEFWGNLTRNRFDSNAEEEIVSSRVNYYHKPIMNLKHLWSPNEKFALSNIVYASFGNGGGTQSSNTQKTLLGRLISINCITKTRMVHTAYLIFITLNTIPISLMTLANTKQSTICLAE